MQEPIRATADHAQIALDKVRFGSYILGETIGTGSFGKVKLAEHAVTGQKVAMKIISRKKMVGMEMVGRVKREIQYLKVLRHPHIIKLYEVFTTPTEIVMVLEYAGDELFNFIVEKGKLSDQEARKYFQQILAAIEYCHRHKMYLDPKFPRVHRDLKPENLLLDAAKNVKIADFGLSNIMTDGDFLKTSCGSPNYAAPEVISGKLYAGPEVDVWSCGVILYVMLCGKLPFDDEYIPSLFKKINEGRFTIPSHVSNEARDLIKSMLVVDPVKRITIPEVRQTPWFLADPLPEYLQSLPLLEDNLFENIDDSIVTEIQKRLKIDPSVIRKALATKPHEVDALLPEKELEYQPLRVAYQLLLDQKKYLDKQLPASMRFPSLPPSLGVSSPIPSMFELPGTKEEFDYPDSISILSSSVSQSVRASIGNSSMMEHANSPKLGEASLSSVAPANGSTRHIQSIASPSPNVLDSALFKKIRPKWHLGIRSKSTPKDILLEIYQAMRSIGAEWKAPQQTDEERLPSGPGGSLGISTNGSESTQVVEGVYKVPARYTQANVGTVYFEWMLYKVPDSIESDRDRRTNNGGGYLVDFKNVGFSQWGATAISSQCDMKATMLFMDICARLIVELAING